MVPPISGDTIVVINHHSHDVATLINSPSARLSIYLICLHPSPASAGRQFILKKVHPQAERIKTREKREGWGA